MTKIEEYLKFVKTSNQHEVSIYKYVYAKEIDYSYDIRHDDPNYS